MHASARYPSESIRACLMRTTRSARLFARAQRSSRAASTARFAPSRRSARRRSSSAARSGARLEDVDGNDFIDYVMSWGPLIHGHAPRGLVKALGRGRARRHELRRAEPARSRARRARARADAVARARALRQLRHRGDDERGPRGAGGDRPRPDRQVRGLLSRPRRCVSRAGRLRRADARRADQPGRDARPRRPTRWSPATTISTRCSALFDANRGQIAALIVEPIAGNMGVVPPADGFLRGLRDAVRRATARC